jgi:hypothetical protein
MSPAEDDFEDLSRPSGGSGADDLADAVVAALGEDPGRLALEPEGDEMAWLVRDGVRVSRVNLRAVASADPGRRDRFARALSDLVRRYDELRPTIEALEPGRSYRVDYKHEKLRRTFRVKGVLVEVSPWTTADGATGGGWILTLESSPRFGEPSRFHVGTDVLTRVVPV